MNKVVLAGLAAAMLGAFLAPVSNACDNLHTSSFTVSSPLSCDPCATGTTVIDNQISSPVLLERDLTAPVLIDNTYSLPSVIDRGVTMPVLIDGGRNHLVDFDSPVIRFGLF